MKRIYLSFTLMATLALACGEKKNQTPTAENNPGGTTEQTADNNPENNPGNPEQSEVRKAPRPDSILVEGDPMLASRAQKYRMIQPLLEGMEKQTKEITLDGKKGTITLFKEGDSRLVCFKASLQGKDTREVEEFYFDEKGAPFYSFTIRQDMNVNGTGQISIAEKKFFIRDMNGAILGLQRSKTGAVAGERPIIKDEAFQPINMDEAAIKEPIKRLAAYQPFIK